MEIRPASVDDRDAILAVVHDAFGHGGRDPQEEVDIVRETWARNAGVDGLELVAVAGDGIAGHVLGARGDLDGHEVVGVAPLAVAPSRQRRGVGSALMTELLARADAQGRPLVVLLGSPDYYSRFGFEPGEAYGITYPPVGAGNPAFQVRRLSRYEPFYRGDFTYCWEMQAAP